MNSFSFKRFINRLSISLAAITLPLYAFKVYRKDDYTDFEVYYRAARRMKAQDWERIYTLTDGASPFRYAPATLPFFRPFAELSPVAGRMVWYFFQFAWFSAGFAILYLCLKYALRKHRSQECREVHAPRETNTAFFATCLTLLFTLRFCLDCFTIGQVSSLLFLGFAGGALGWMLGRPALSGAALFLPTLFKIGPGFLYGIYLSTRPRHRARAWIAPVLLVSALLAIVSALAFGWNGALLGKLWKNWFFIVQNDSGYFDASHYGSQSMKSALLRLAKLRWITLDTASALYVSLMASGCIAIILFWVSRRPRSFLGRGLFFSLGIFAYLWFMPETFKYSLTAAAIPIAFLIASELERERPSWLTRFALAFFFVFVSAAGKDLVGDTIFFGLQKLSVPLLATEFLALAVVLEAWRHSSASRMGRKLGEYLHSTPVGPWRNLPEVAPGASAPLRFSAWIPLPLDAFSGIETPEFRNLVIELKSLLSGHAPDSFEIVVVPYGRQVSALAPCLLEARELSRANPEIRILEPSPVEGRGAALREAYLSSRGARIWVLNPEQAADLSFYSAAERAIDSGAALVRGNRRLSESRFRVPVRVLHLVYGRHRLGLLFNRLVRAFLPIRSTDTHSGIFALTREAADAIFALQSTGGFLFDLEVSLIVSQNSLKETDLPLHIHLFDEKKPSRMVHETLAIFFGLPRVRARHRKGLYRREHGLPRLLWTADDWGITPGVNQAIVELARAGVIRRTSAMANSRYLRDGLSDAQAIRTLQLGMHFDLTFGKSSPGRVLLDWIVLRGKKREILIRELRAEFERQLRILKENGIQPRHLDGHHHVHVVPGIFEAIADLLQREGIREVRLPYDPQLWLSSKLPLTLLSLRLERKVRKLGFEPIPFFYPQARHFADPAAFRKELTGRSGTEVIVHPALEGDFRKLGIPDPYSDERVIEYQALKMLAATTGGATS